MTTSEDSPPVESAHAAHRRELMREGCTMAMYVAICLFAELSLTTSQQVQQIDVLKLIWGTTIGLSLAHWFAFQLSARLMTGGRIHRHHTESILAELAGAAFVAVLATLPVLLLDADSEVKGVRLLIGVLLGFAGFAVARANAGSVWRALVYGGVTLTIGLTVALVKNSLTGH